MKRELRRVLLADDDEAIRMIAAMSLELGGLEVIQCASGVEAVQAAPSAGADLFLLDVMMPGINGLETAERLRAISACAATPVVFLTARVMPQDVAEYKAKGALDVIVKPFDSAGLAKQLCAIFAHARRGEG